MSDNDLVTIASYVSQQEASIAKGALDDESIPAYLIGTEAASTLWHVGTALGGVKLQVAERDAQKAAEVLGVIQSTDKSESIGPWTCSNCSAEVDAGFEVCWSCESSQGPQSSVPGSNDSGDLPCPAIVDSSTNKLAKSDAVTSNADEMAARAWRSAVFGIAFPPLLVYSFLQLLKLGCQELGSVATRQFYGALALVFTMFVLYWSLFHFLG